MRRREFVAGIGVAAATAWPNAIQAQQRAPIRHVGVLIGGSDDGGWRARTDAFQRALAQLGWRDGDNLKLELLWATRDPERGHEIAKELVARKPDVILAGPSNIVKALQAETRTIPIVFVSVSDPVAQGLVQSIARPTSNLTGFTNLEFSMIGKWLSILNELAPGVTRVALMIATVNAASAEWYRHFDAITASVGIKRIAAPVQELRDIERAFEALSRAPNGALIVPGDTFVDAPIVRRLIIDQAAMHRVPALFATSVFVRDGGLVSYGVEQFESYRLAASYVDRILKGSTPAELPVQQPTRFQFAINLRTAKALGLNVPLTLQASADEVIE